MGRFQCVAQASPSLYFCRSSDILGATDGRRKEPIIGSNATVSTQPSDPSEHLIGSPAETIVNAPLAQSTLSNDARRALLETAFEPKFMILVAAGHDAALRVYRATVEKLQRATAGVAGPDANERVERVLAIAADQARATTVVAGAFGCDREGVQRAQQKRIEHVNAIRAETQRRVADKRTICAYDYFAKAWVAPAVLAERDGVLPHLHSFVPNGAENFPLTAALRLLVLESTFDAQFMELVAAGDAAAVRAYDDFAKMLDEETSAEAAQRLADERPCENVADLISVRIQNAAKAVAAQTLAIQEAHEIRQRSERVRSVNERVGTQCDVERIRRETEEREDAGLNACVYDYRSGRWVTDESLIARGALLPHVHGRHAAFGSVAPVASI